MWPGDAIDPDQAGTQASQFSECLNHRQAGWQTAFFRGHHRANHWDLRIHFSDRDRKSTRLNSRHSQISYAVFCLKKKNPTTAVIPLTHRKHPHRFIVITSCHPDAASDDWNITEQPIRRRRTLVYLMALARLSNI